MEDYEPAMSFDAAVAERYDADTAGMDTDVTVDLLAELAGAGPALELAIGTGRVALPLSERGIRVDGIDISTAMVDKLREKPGGADMNVAIGDFADVSVDGEYVLIYVVFNTIGNLLTQDDQVRCFENVARHLTPDGRFVVELTVPTFGSVVEDSYVEAEMVGTDEVRLEVAHIDRANQMWEGNHVSLTRDGVRLGPIVQRYIWPSEMDLMARIAGLRLLERWGGWSREPFTSMSFQHVSVYGR